ncbi:DUF933 domain-containing protein [Chloroflexota bacterium]
MGIDIGIIGLPQSGKTTVFSSLTGGRTDKAAHVAAGSSAHVGIAKVPEPRLKILADIFCPRKVVPVEVRYVDTGAESPGQLGSEDILIYVVRAFTGDCVPHIKGSVDAGRDMAAIDTELAFSDLAIIKRRLNRIDVSLKGARQPERQGLLREQELLLKIRGGLEKDVPIRELKFTPDEARTLSGYQFLAAKPLLVIANIDEAQLSGAASWEAELNSRYSRDRCRVIVLSAKLEMELGQLDDSAAVEFRCEFGLKQPGRDRVIRQSCELAGLVSFFTTVSAEVRAWSIKSGTTALRAAGKIHSDMERGFIRAEVISYDNLLQCGTLAEARKKGLLRLEGKDYIIQDGDVVTFLFNV